MHDSSNNSMVRSSIPIQTSDLVFDSYAGDWAPNNVPASVYLICTDGTETLSTNPFSLVKEFAA
jgi:hypothetical protein